MEWLLSIAEAFDRRVSLAYLGHSEIMALIPVSSQFIQALSPLLDVSDVFSIIITFSYLSRVTVRAALYLRQSTPLCVSWFVTGASFSLGPSVFLQPSINGPSCLFYINFISLLAVFYVTLGLFMSLFVRLGRIILNFWVYKNLFYYWVGSSDHFSSFTLVFIRLLCLFSIEIRIWYHCLLFFYTFSTCSWLLPDNYLLCAHSTFICGPWIPKVRF